MMTSHLPEPHYRLRCTGCGRIHRDDDLSMPLSCDAHHPPALLRSEYRRARFRPIEARPGLFRYADAWQRRSRTLDLDDEGLAKERIARIDAGVLSNRTPPYALTGGLYDALADSDGRMYGVTNAEARQAAELFERTEGCDLDPAAADRRVAADEPVVINLTGGGRARAARELPNVPTVPDLFVAPSDLQSIPERVARLAERRAA